LRLYRNFGGIQIGVNESRQEAVGICIGARPVAARSAPECG
jgi:hypothetical protein